MSISPPNTYRKISMNIAVVAVPAMTSCGVRKNRSRALWATPSAGSHAGRTSMVAQGRWRGHRASFLRWSSGGVIGRPSATSGGLPGQREEHLVEGRAAQGEVIDGTPSASRSARSARQQHLGSLRRRRR
jgi:hypothetical protein